MRPLPTPAVDASATRGLAPANAQRLPSNPPLAPLSCFITNEAGLESLASSPERGRRAKTPVQDFKTLGPTPFDCSAGSSRPASLASLSDMDYAMPHSPMPAAADAPGARSIISEPLSPTTSSSCCLSEGPKGSSNASAAASPTRASRQGAPASLSGSSVPQLVMPSLTVPERRSFSEVGKSLGRLKLLVAGRSGIGKTSLIDALGHNCQHIVHMDPRATCLDGKVKERYASSRLDPWWRASLEPDAHASRRGQMLSEDVLDRNLCFLDCPVTAEESEAERYVHSQLLRLCDRPADDDQDLFHLLTSGAESIVHAVLYLLPSVGPSPADVRCLKSLQKITNVIPLLAKADELTSDELALAKVRLGGMLSDEGIEWFSFEKPASTKRALSVYAISNTITADTRTLDGGIHMSFEVLQSRASTDLEELIDRIFSLDGSSWLRCSAALKSVSWRRRQLRDGSSRALTVRSNAAYGALVPITGTRQYFERRQWGRIELSSWAESLQQSLKAERSDRLPQVLDLNRGSGMLLAKMALDAGSGPQTGREPPNANNQDPLGLLELGGHIRHGGRLTLELVSSLGVFGCIAMWLVRPEMSRYWDAGWPWSGCLARP